MKFRDTDKKNIISFIVVIIILVWYFFIPVSAYASAISWPAMYSEEKPIKFNEGLVYIDQSKPIAGEMGFSPRKLPKEEEVVKYPSDVSAYAVPTVNTSFKSFTYYTSLSRSSTQWRLQEKAYTDKNGLRKIENYYLVAVGTYYSSTIGDLFRFTTDTGNVFEIIVCDIKANKHTDSRNMYTRGKNPCMVEFYVAKTLCKTAKVRGSIGVLSGFEGSIVKVEKLGHYNWE